MEEEENWDELPERPVWDIRLEGRSWTYEEWVARGDVLPEKMELIEGRLFWIKRHRLGMLAAMLEQVGLKEAVRLAPKSLWLEALNQVED